ncbi:MAG: DUF1189 family protein [Rickettsiales bacterium]
MFKNNYLDRIIKSFYHKDYYNFVAFQQKNTGINLLIFIIFLTYLVPTILMYQKFKSFSFAKTNNQELAEISKGLLEIPDFFIKDGKLSSEHNPNLPYDFGVSFLAKKLVVFNDQENSLINANSLVVFAEKGVYFDNLELIFIILRLFSSANVPLDKISPINTNFMPYSADNTLINGEKLHEGVEKTINYMGNMLFSLLPTILIAALVLKLLEIMIMSLITILLLNKRGIKLAYKKIFALTLTAMIPSLILKALNAFSLWSSYLISNGSIGSLFILILNIYFISYAVNVLQQRKSEFV